jgi:hypothetical protein
LLRPAPLRTGRARFHASGSSKPVGVDGRVVVRRRAASLGPFTAEAASNLSLGSDSSSTLSWARKGADAGQVSPIGLSGHPVPARELGLPHGRLTGRDMRARTRTGFARSALRDTTGVGALSTPGTAVLSRPDAVPGRRLPLPSDQSLHPAPASHQRGSVLRGINEGSRDSPVRPAPRL